jgi:hypothetical protein
MLQLILDSMQDEESWTERELLARLVPLQNLKLEMLEAVAWDKSFSIPKTTKLSIRQSRQVCLTAKTEQADGIYCSLKIVQSSVRHP